LIELTNTSQQIQIPISISIPKEQQEISNTSFFPLFIIIGTIAVIFYFEHVKKKKTNININKYKQINT